MNIWAVIINFIQRVFSHIVRFLAFPLSIMNIVSIRFNQTWGVFVILLTLFIPGMVITFIIWIIGHNNTPFLISTFLWSVFVFYLLIIIVFIRSSYFDLKGIKKLAIVPSSSHAMIFVSRIAGVKDLTKQEIRDLTKNRHVYEVHLKKKYSKQGKITPEEIIMATEQLYATLDNAVFYTISPINLPDKLEDRPDLIPTYLETKIPKKAALRLRDRLMPFYFYCLTTSGPTVE